MASEAGVSLRHRAGARAAEQPHAGREGAAGTQGPGWGAQSTLLVVFYAGTESYTQAF